MFTTHSQISWSSKPLAQWLKLLRDSKNFKILTVPRFGNYSRNNRNKNCMTLCSVRSASASESTELWRYINLSIIIIIIIIIIIMVEID